MDKRTDKVLALYVHGCGGTKPLEINTWYEQELEWEQLPLRANCLFCTTEDCCVPRTLPDGLKFLLSRNLLQGGSQQTYSTRGDVRDEWIGRQVFCHFMVCLEKTSLGW